MDLPSYSDRSKQEQEISKFRWQLRQINTLDELKRIVDAEADGPELALDDEPTVSLRRRNTISDISKRVAVAGLSMAALGGLAFLIHENHDNSVANSPAIHLGHIAQDAAGCVAVGSGTHNVYLDRALSDYQFYQEIKSSSDSAAVGGNPKTNFEVSGYETCTPNSFMARVAMSNSGNVLQNSELATGGYSLPNSVKPAHQ